MTTPMARRLIWLQRGDEGYGVASTVLQFSESISGCGWQVILVCIGEGELAASMRHAGFQVEVLGMPQPPFAIRGNVFQRAALVVRSRRRTRAATRAALALPVFSTSNSASRIGQSGPDIVQTMNVLQTAMVGRCKNAIQGVGIWRMAHGVRGGRLGPLARWLVRRPLDKFGLINMGNSDHTTRSLKRNSPLSVSNLHGCKASRFSPETVEPFVRNQFDIDDDDIVFAIIARLAPDGDKGQDRVAEALARLISDKKLDKRVHLLVVGGPADTAFGKKIKQYSNKEKGFVVHVLGASDKVECFYPMIDVAINARVTPEPFGLSVVEAMLMGVPVLAHSLGGPAETIVDGNTGWLVHDSSVEAWIGALSRVLADRRSWSAFGSAARQRALTEYTLENEVARWITQVDEVAGFEADSRLSNSSPKPVLFR